MGEEHRPRPDGRGTIDELLVHFLPVDVQEQLRRDGSSGHGASGHGANASEPLTPLARLGLAQAGFDAARIDRIALHLALSQIERRVELLERQPRHNLSEAGIVGIVLAVLAAVAGIVGVIVMLPAG